ncbi:MAG: TonB-dependent receptor [Alphaproteobacteria bacterium]
MALLGGVGWTASAAQAADEPEATLLDEVIVTATRLPTSREEVASSITVVTAEEIEQKQQRTIVDVLRTVPGLNVVQQGGPGNVAAVFMRGTNANQTLVLIDGIEVNDPSSPNGAFDFGKLLTGNVERIEILRGPQSTLYGSDAIGGVINVITKKGEGAPSLTTRFEGGSFATNSQYIALHGATPIVNYSASFERFATDNVSITPADDRPPNADDETDPYENFSTSIRLGLTPADNFELDLIARYVDTQLDLDVSPEDPNSLSKTKGLFLRGEGDLILFDGLFQQRLGVSYTDYDRVDTNDPDFLSSDSSRTTNDASKLKFDWQGDVYVLDDQIVTFGLETEEEEIDSNSQFSSGFTSATEEKARTDAAFVQGKFAYADRLFGTVGVRIDDHELFSSEETYRITGAYLLRETGTKLKATYGTGFKAPTLFQLFAVSSFFGFRIFRGNPDLQPETSKGWDAGFEQSLFDRRLSFGATFFRNDIENLIESSPDFTTLINVGEAETWGVETYVAAELDENLTARADYSYIRAQDAIEGDELLRRPKHKASASIVYSPLPGVHVVLDTLFVGRRADIDAVTFARITDPSFSVTNLALAYDFLDGWRLFGRIENMFDRNYQDPDGFAQRGIGGFAGVSGTF